MPKILQSVFAKQDLFSIWDYIAKNDLVNADKFLDEIEAKFHLLAKSPEIGAPRYDLIENLRSFPIKRYIIFYRPIEDGVEIVRVLHGMRDIPRLFEEGE